MSSRGPPNKQPRKNAREERLQFMNSQAELIAQKKREIEAKLAEKQNVAAEPTQTVNNAEPKTNPEVQTTPAVSSQTKPPAAAIGFKNDGSFLEMFRKLQQQQQATVKVEEKANHEEKCPSPSKPSPVQMSAQPPVMSRCFEQSYKNPETCAVKTEPGVDVKPPKTQFIQQFSSVNESPAQAVAKVKVEKRSPSPYSPTRPSSEEEDLVMHRKETTSEPVKEEPGSSLTLQDTVSGENAMTERERKRRSRWGPKGTVDQLPVSSIPAPSSSQTVLAQSSLLTRITKADPQILIYASKVFGTTDLTEDQWKQCMDQIKMQYVYQEMLRKKQEREQLELAGKVKYEYDSDEDTEGGTWEHKRRALEMEKTRDWADQLTSQARGRHHIGDFLPPEELAKFMEKYRAMKEGRSTEDCDFNDFKIAEDNVGYQMLKKFGWTEGQGLGAEGSGITEPINATRRTENQGLGASSVLDLAEDDDEYDAYRKRMMLAYRFRPNPLNNPRRSYY